MYTLIHCAKEQEQGQKEKEELDFDAIQDELEFQEFHLGLFAEY
jgi:hypothetical protein